MEVALNIATSRLGDIYTRINASRRTRDRHDDLEPRVSSKHVKTVTIKQEPEVDEISHKMSVSPLRVPFFEKNANFFGRPFVLNSEVFSWSYFFKFKTLFSHAFYSALF